MSQSSDGARQKIPISEPRHRAGDGGIVVHDGGLVRIQESHGASLEGKFLGDEPRVPSAFQSAVAVQRQDLAAFRGGSGSRLPSRQIVGA
jgi:hypothetical protein